MRQRYAAGSKHAILALLVYDWSVTLMLRRLQFRKSRRQMILWRLLANGKFLCLCGITIIYASFYWSHHV
jgi:hypothetical protein